MNDTKPKKMDVSLTSNTSTEPSFDYRPKQTLERKWMRILRVMLHGTVNRFEAECHGDHCLNSTVSEIGSDHQISIDWVWEEVPAMGGQAVARVKRYWVERTESNLNRARGLLGIA